MQQIMPAVSIQYKRKSNKIKIQQNAGNTKTGNGYRYGTVRYEYCSVKILFIVFWYKTKHNSNWNVYKYLSISGTLIAPRRPILVGSLITSTMSLLL